MSDMFELTVCIINTLCQINSVSLHNQYIVPILLELTVYTIKSVPLIHYIKLDLLDLIVSTIHTFLFVMSIRVNILYHPHISDAKSARVTSVLFKHSKQNQKTVKFFSLSFILCLSQQ